MHKLWGQTLPDVGLQTTPTVTTLTVTTPFSKMVSSLVGGKNA